MSGNVIASPRKTLLLIVIVLEVGVGEDGATVAVGQLTQTGWQDMMPVPVRYSCCCLLFNPLFI